MASTLERKRERRRRREQKNENKHKKKRQKEVAAARQTTLDFPSGWGGPRPGAGRPKLPNSGVPHTTRPALASRFPVLVTTKILDDLPRLRNEKTRRTLERHLAAGSDRFGFRLVMYSIQTNHIHMICEAKDKDALARGMQGLKVRLAKGLNKMWGRRGTVFADRYHSRILRTPREVRNAIAYVLHNGRRHGRNIQGIDVYSSGAEFDGWKEVPDVIRRGPPVVAPAHTWLLTVGWRRHGLISIFETPKAGR